MSETCPGLFRSEIDGTEYCPKDVATCPPEWQTWESHCAQCRDNQERWAELEREGRMERAMERCESALESEGL